MHSALECKCYASARWLQSSNLSKEERHFPRPKNLGLFVIFFSVHVCHLRGRSGKLKESWTLGPRGWFRGGEDLCTQKASDTKPSMRTGWVLIEC